MAHQKKEAREGAMGALENLQKIYGLEQVHLREARSRPSAVKPAGLRTVEAGDRGRAGEQRGENCREHEIVPPPWGRKYQRRHSAEYEDRG